ncbi:cupin domain-containing protein [Roseovarius sp. LXJ103]|uniref:cupin domain-containing protein n=1 Tax=Roseovarius carneus TaxID=2853164 RepID=UPI000D6133EA|nr:cupin domain-containing protein [Roseovarius carneus]MBZ8118748.1 cupin domain-containing protein [Roseovarius carneus]PWE35578.1 cupin domain-containing protein [Pelagicola sp. LXJ1103]
MPFPDFMQTLPSLNLPFPEDIVQSNAVLSEAGLVVFFTFHKDMDLPPHAHRAQWGSVIEGEIEMTIGDETKIYGPGDSYFIPEGVTHSARIAAGSRVIDVFEETDRYPLKG